VPLPQSGGSCEHAEGEPSCRGGDEGAAEKRGHKRCDKRQHVASTSGLSVIRSTPKCADSRLLFEKCTPAPVAPVEKSGADPHRTCNREAIYSQRDRSIAPL